MPGDRIERVEGVPRWFGRLYHWYAKRRYCRENGHTLSRWDSCDVCGEWVG